MQLIVISLVITQANDFTFNGVQCTVLKRHYVSSQTITDTHLYFTNISLWMSWLTNDITFMIAIYIQKWKK